MKRMRRKGLLVGGVVLGLLVLLVLILALSGPLAVRLGIKPVCIQGEWPHLRFVSCPRPTAAAAVVTPWPLPSPDGQGPIPIIVDDDGSPDGVIALLYLLRNPLFQVKAVTISYGEAHPALFAGHLQQLLAGLGRTDIPVGAGPDAPLAGNNAFPDPWRQASDTFWGITLPGTPVATEPVPAAELIVGTLRASRKPMAVLVTGAHTNLAEALRLDPGAAAQIRDVYVMGGAIHTDGNIYNDWPQIDNRVAEWNIWADPTAADEVLAAGLPLHLVPLDATQQVLWTEADAARWASSGSAEGALAAEILRSTLRSFGRGGSMYIWDLIAAEAATDARLCPEQSLSLDVTTTHGPEQGDIVIAGGSPNAAVCLAPNADQMRARAASIWADTPIASKATPLPATGSVSPGIGSASSATATVTEAATVTPIPPTARPEPSASPTPAAASTTWRKTYGQSRNTVSDGLLIADDGGLLLAGTTNLEFEPEQRGDAYLLRTDAAGQVLWEKTYGGDGYDAAQSIIETRDGNLLLAGTTTSFGAQGMDAYVLLVDRDGKELWSKTYGGPLDEMVGAIGQTPDGGYLLGGNIVDPNDAIADPGAAGYGGFAGRANLYLLKVAGDGTELWSRTYDSPDNVIAGSAALMPDGGVLAVATVTRFPDPDNDILLLRVDGEGHVAWSRTWEKGRSEASALVATSDGSYLIAASYTAPESQQAGKQDFLFIKIDAQGQEIWRSLAGDPELIDHGARLALTSDGGYIAVGEQARDLNTWETNLVLIKLDENGQPLWQKTWPSAHTMYSGIVQHPAGGFVLAGGKYEGNRFNALLVKTNGEGAVGEPAAAPDRSTVAGEIAAGIQKLAAQGRFSGAVLIAKDGEPVLRQAYGQADRQLDVPNQVDTKFDLGSMDKMFTAVAILQLVEQGKLSLRGTIADYVPDYTNQEVARSVTIHQLLTHTSGLGDYFESERFDRLHDQLRSVEDYLALFVDAPLEFKPGEQVRYSNSGYIVLGLIIEKITGQSYYDYVRKSIFEPSGMTDTGAYELDAHVPNLAWGYTRFDARYNETANIHNNSYMMPMRGGPAGGGYSTVDDLLRFSNALLAHKLLSAATTDLALAPKVRLGANAQYGYGFMDRGTANQRIVGHGGGAPGICSMLNIFLDKGYTMVVLTNGDEDCLAAYEVIKAALLP